MSALHEQIGGNHYKDFAIQPVEFIHKNDIGFIEGNIIKYICRYKSKCGVDDLKKVKHYVELLIELSDAVKTEGCCKFHYTHEDFLWCHCDCHNNTKIEYCRQCTDINEGVFVKKTACNCNKPLKCLDCDAERTSEYLYCNKCKGRKKND